MPQKIERPLSGAKALPETATQPSELSEDETRYFGALDRFRTGLTGRIGRTMAFIAAFSSPQIVQGVTYQRAEAAPGAVQKLNKKDLQDLKQHKPDVVENGENDIWLGFGGTREQLSQKGAIEQQVVNQEKTTGQLEARFTWGGREFKDAKLREAEAQRLEAEIRPRLTQLLAPYKEFGLDQQALKQIVIQGEVFSSPEGHARPQANLELSRQRAELLTQVINKIMQEQGVEASRVKIEIEGRGARGDVLDMGQALENIGYKFKTDGQDTEARRREVERIIQRVHDGEFGAIFSRLPAGQRDREIIQAIYDNTIAAQRVAELKVTAETKAVHLGVAKQAPDKKEQETLVQELSRPESWQDPRLELEETLRRGAKAAKEEEEMAGAIPIINRKLKNIGYKFESNAKDTEARNREVEGIIQNIRQDDLEAVFSHLPPTYRDRELIRGYYADAVAAQRVAERKILTTKTGRPAIAEKPLEKDRFLAELEEARRRQAEIENRIRGGITATEEPGEKITPPIFRPTRPRVIGVEPPPPPPPPRLRRAEERRLRKNVDILLREGINRAPFHRVQSGSTSSGGAFWRSV